MQGWTRPDQERTFLVTHDDYAIEWMDGWDYDINKIRVRETTVVGEPALQATLREWNLEPSDFTDPWKTAVPT